MRAFVYTDKALASRAGQFAWLAMNTEKAENAGLLVKFPVAAWPSLFIVDPASEKVVVRWTGGASVEQLGKLLDDGRAAVAAKPATSELATALAAADRLYGEAKYAEAAPLYKKAIGLAPARWTQLPRVADAYLYALSTTDDNAACATAAGELLPRVAGTPSVASVAASGLDCALSLPKEDPHRADLATLFEKACTAALADPNLTLSTDDRSGIYQELIAAHDEAGDEAGRKILEKAWVALLEDAAARATTPDARAVFDSHRVSAYIQIGEPARALPMLEASERDLPADYNPPARLAIIYKELKDYERALAASDRALTKAYGPRRLTILRTRAQIFVDKGDRDGARKVLEQALAEAAALPAGQRSERVLAALQKQLASLEPAPPTPPTGG